MTSIKDIMVAQEKASKDTITDLDMNNATITNVAVSTQSNSVAIKRNVDDGLMLAKQYSDANLVTAEAYTDSKINNVDDWHVQTFTDFPYPQDFSVGFEVKYPINMKYENPRNEFVIYSTDVGNITFFAEQYSSAGYKTKLFNKTKAAFLYMPFYFTYEGKAANYSGDGWQWGKFNLLIETYSGKSTNCFRIETDFRLWLSNGKITAPSYHRFRSQHYTIE